MANQVWFLGQRLVLRIANRDPASAAALPKEAAIIPLAGQAGVRTPELVAFDPSPELLGAPYLVLQRVAGANLGSLGLDPRATPQAYQDLGRDLARWHSRATGSADPLHTLGHDPNPDLRPGVDRLVASGHLSADLARWFGRWLDRLAPEGLVPVAPRVVHGDASRGVVTEPRVLWFHLGWALATLGRAPAERADESTWSAPPAGRILELLRFFLDPPSTTWSRRGPGPQPPEPSGQS